MGSKTTLQLSGGGEIEIEKNELKRVKMLKPEYEKKKPGGKKEKGKGKETEKEKEKEEEKKEESSWVAGTDNEFVVLVDMSQSDTQTQMTVAREVASKVNKLRKEFKLNFQDKIQIFFEPV